MNFQLFQEESGILVYENRITSSYEVALGPNGAITRDSSFQYVLFVLFRLFFFLFKTMIDSIIRKMN